ncbi:alpha/beta fold hydrolase [Nocardia cyriacigeorgica]|uniref:alpha/beta fold hydrolase n=1 Tax=Nocardia cyriacigeorgica TaxID=135487 RepID=UPI00030AB86D|nr:alpha/beta fold hydrolase [Nocardia cyriacigeorgica]
MSQAAEPDKHSASSTTDSATADTGNGAAKTPAKAAAKKAGARAARATKSTASGTASGTAAKKTDAAAKKAAAPAKKRAAKKAAPKPATTTTAEAAAADATPAADGATGDQPAKKAAKSTPRARKSPAAGTASRPAAKKTATKAAARKTAATKAKGTSPASDSAVTDAEPTVTQAVAGSEPATAAHEAAGSEPTTAAAGLATTETDSAGATSAEASAVSGETASEDTSVSTSERSTAGDSSTGVAPGPASSAAPASTGESATVEAPGDADAAAEEGSSDIADAADGSAVSAHDDAAPTNGEPQTDTSRGTAAAVDDAASDDTAAASGDEGDAADASSETSAAESDSAGEEGSSDNADAADEGAASSAGDDAASVSDGQTHADSGSFIGHGARIEWRAWLPDSAARGVIVLVHGVAEHAGRYEHVGRRLAGAGFAVYALDHPGHGHSGGARANIGSMDAAADNVATLLAMARLEFPEVPAFLLGHSMGSLIVLFLATRAPIEVDGVVVSAPPLDIPVGNPIQRMLAPVLTKLTPNLGVLKLDSTDISRDPKVVAAYDSDPLVYRGKLPARTATEILNAAMAVKGRLRKLTAPTLAMHGTADTIAAPSSTDLIEKGAGAEDLTVRRYDGLYHEIFNEPEQDQVLTDVVDWLEARLGK